MKAIVCKRYGSPEVLNLEEIEKPLVGDNEVLIKVRAASLNAADWHIMRGSPYFMRFIFGFKGPKYSVPGSDVSGIVEAVGKHVTRFQVGDEVFGNLYDDGKSAKGFGALAEYACANEEAFVRKPSNLTFEAAAAIPLAATTAFQALRSGQAQAGKKVLINGASGGVGTFAVQIAKALGCEVTATCSKQKMETIKANGADYVIDYRVENVTKLGRKYDIIIAANGYHPIGHYNRILETGGYFISVGGDMKQMFQAMLIGPLLSKRDGKHFSFLYSKTDAEDLESLRAFALAGKIRPVIDKSYGLDNIREAMCYLEEGQAAGKIIISMS